jgi:hypothetical protein
VVVDLVRWSPDRTGPDFQALSEASVLGKSHNWLLDRAMHLLATRWSELSRMGGRAKQGVEGGKLRSMVA